MLGAFLFCIVLTGLGACTESNDNPVSPGDYGGGGDIDYDINNVEVIESGVMKTADIFDDIIKDNADLEDKEDSIYYEWATEHKKYIISDEQAATRASNEDRTGEDGKGDTGYLKNVKWVTIRYKTKSVTGADIWCSALVVWPYNAIRANPNPTNLIIGCHCTITSNDERPTNFSKLKTGTDVGMMALQWVASKANCLLVVPDYEGYGATHGSPHPYCNRDVTAVQVLDGAKAGLAWYTRNEKKMAYDWRTYAVGYSQGGAVAAGTYRYYREKKMDGMGFFGAVCGDGPYDPLATLKEYIKQDKLYMPVAPALLLKGAVDTNKDLKALGCIYGDFVRDDFYNTGIFDYLNLSFGLSGFSFWSHDMGGFVTASPEDIYRRWLPFGFLSSHTRAHGAPPTEPWLISESFTDAFRACAEMKYKLMPYVYAQAKDCTERGLPMVRALLVEFPQDKGAWFVEDEYMFGSQILVAPMMESGNSRDVYLPKGKWIDYQSGKVYEGGYQTIEAGKIPAIILVRDGSLIPHAPLAQRTDQIDWNKIEMKTYKADATRCTGLLLKPGDKVLQTIER